MMKQNSILVIALLALIVMAVMPVQAQTITMSNPDATMERDIIVYSVNDTGLTNTTGIYGLYNTTSIIDIDPNLSYLFVLTPQYSNPLEEPGLVFSSTFNFVVANIAPILIIIFLIGLLLSRRRS
jgi:hypothetical protein